MIEAGERSEDKDSFLVGNWVGGGGEIVELVVDHWRRYSFAIWLSGLLTKGCCRWREWIRRWRVVLGLLDGIWSGLGGRREYKEKEADEEESTEKESYWVSPPA